MKSSLFIKLIFIFLFYLPLQSIERPTITLIFDAPLKKVEKWNDGFIAAIKLLEKEYQIVYFNLSNPPDLKILEKSDLILVKSNWGCDPDLFARSHCPLHVPKCLLISGVNPPPSLSEMLFYDILFYETYWYKSFIKEHPCILHAFGINSDVMKPGKIPLIKKYDIISVGEFKPEKRFEKLLQKQGKRLVVGLIYDENNPIIQTLKKNNVLIKDFVMAEELARLYQQSKCCYIPCTIEGGGERAVLEARSCGIHVEVEKDNPKLIELTKSPIYNHFYYCKKLKKGIKRLLKS